MPCTKKTGGLQLFHATYAVWLKWKSDDKFTCVYTLAAPFFHSVHRIQMHNDASDLPTNVRFIPFGASCVSISLLIPSTFSFGTRMIVVFFSWARGKNTPFNEDKRFTNSPHFTPTVAELTYDGKTEIEGREREIERDEWRKISHKTLSFLNQFVVKRCFDRKTFFFSFSAEEKDEKRNAIQNLKRNIVKLHTHTRRAHGEQKKVQSFPNFAC